MSLKWLLSYHIERIIVFHTFTKYVNICRTLVLWMSQVIINECSYLLNNIENFFIGFDCYKIKFTFNMNNFTVLADLRWPYIENLFTTKNLNSIRSFKFNINSAQNRFPLTSSWRWKILNFSKFQTIATIHPSFHIHLLIRRATCWKFSTQWTQATKRELCSLEQSISSSQRSRSVRENREIRKLHIFKREPSKDIDGFYQSLVKFIWKKKKFCLNLFHKVCNQNLHNFLTLNVKVFHHSGCLRLHFKTFMSWSWKEKSAATGSLINDKSPTTADDGEKYLKKIRIKYSGE